jgi:predicted transposase/invertase (TIGR01784 family)
MQNTEKITPAPRIRFSVPAVFRALELAISKEPIELDPKSDIVFKAIFTHGKEGKTALLGLINAVLDLPAGKKIAKIEYLNTHVHGMFHSQKKPVMDVMVRSEDDKLINIEMQIDDKDNFFHRTQHYLACMIHDQSISGEQYSTLKPCIGINILNYSLETGLTAFHTCYRLHETTSRTEIPFGLTEIHFLELPKLNEYIKGVAPAHALEKWAFYFRDLPKSRYPEIIRGILREEKDIQMAENARIKIGLMEKFMYSYRSYQRARLDERSSRYYLRDKALREGREEGIAEGKAEGKAEAKSEMIKKLKNEGVSNTIIAHASGLSEEEIEKLL